MVRRLVGPWISSALFLLAAPVAAQSTGSFPDDPTPAPAPAAPAPVPAPVTPVAPQPAPAPAPSVAPTPPTLTPDSLRGPPVPTGGTALQVPPRPTAPATSSEQPPLLPYRDGMPVPDGYTVVDRPATGLLTAGLVGLGVSYAVGVIIGASQGFENGTGLLAIPVIGPYAAVGTREYECSVSTVAAAKRCTVGEVQIVTLVAVDGLAQTAGALVALAGLVSGEKDLVRNDLLEVNEVNVTPPTGERSGWNFSVGGRF